MCSMAYKGDGVRFYFLCLLFVRDNVKRRPRRISRLRVYLESNMGEGRGN
jgi:hypothetical protein